MLGGTSTVNYKLENNITACIVGSEFSSYRLKGCSVCITGVTWVLWRSFEENCADRGFFARTWLLRRLCSRSLIIPSRLLALSDTYFTAFSTVSSSLWTNAVCIVKRMCVLSGIEIGFSPSFFWVHGHMIAAISSQDTWSHQNDRLQYVLLLYILC
jgi:hypothetical protein